MIAVVVFKGNIAYCGTQTLENTEGAIKKENPKKLATQGTQADEKQHKTQHNMCWTPLYAIKHK